MKLEVLSVLLVDDHAVVREGYRRLLEHTADLRVTAEASSGEEAYRLYGEHQTDIVIMDVNLPGMTGIETTRRIRARHPHARVLVFSMHEEEMVAYRALQAGARGYVTKSSAPEELVQAVHAIAAGRVYINHEVAQRLALKNIPGQHMPLAALSPKEFEVFRLMALGLTPSEVGDRLNLGQKTVANYQSMVRQKLEITNAAQIVRLAIASGLVTAGAPALDDGTLSGGFPG